MVRGVVSRKEYPECANYIYGDAAGQLGFHERQ